MTCPAIAESLAIIVVVQLFLELLSPSCYLCVWHRFISALEGGLIMIIVKSRIRIWRLTMPVKILIAHIFPVVRKFRIGLVHAQLIHVHLFTMIIRWIRRYRNVFICDLHNMLASAVEDGVLEQRRSDGGGVGGGSGGGGGGRRDGRHMYGARVVRAVQEYVGMEEAVGSA
jgi:uncharacterized membrane protein YgcG